MAAPQSNFFDLSHDVKLSFKMGRLVPICAVDMVPGDSFNISYESMLRFSALIAPIMHRIKVTQHYFFVPNRILWDNWEKFITQESDIDPPYFVPPYVDGVVTQDRTGIHKGSVADYMGLPLVPTAAVEPTYLPQISAFPFAAYWRIMAEYYMDQNIQTGQIGLFESLSDLEDGNQGMQFSLSACYNDNATGFSSYGPVNRAWSHDYFTSALPWAQKGQQVEIPIGDFTDVPLEWTGNPVPFQSGDTIRNTDGTTYTPAANSSLQAPRS